MSNSIIPYFAKDLNGFYLYKSDGMEIRAQLNQDGDPYFIANDLAEPLGINNVRQALSRLEADEKDVILNDTPGGVQSVAVVTEAGFYSLVLSSRKPKAKAFKRWVVHEVLPSIRKEGFYVSGSLTAEQAQKLKQRVADLEKVYTWITGMMKPSFVEMSDPDRD